MPMIDFRAQQSECDGQLATFSVKADGKVEEAFLITTDVAFVIKPDDDIAALERLFPGAGEIVTLADREDTNWKYNATVTPDVRSTIKADLSHAAKGKVCIQGGCELTTVKLRASKKAVVATVRLVFGGQDAKAAGLLPDLLRATACLSIELDQQVLAFPKQSTGDGPPMPVTGDLVVGSIDGGETVCGRVASIDGPRLVLEDFAAEYALDASQVTAVLKLGGDAKAMIRNYKSQCTRAKVSPSWEAIVVAAAETADVLSGAADLEMNKVLVKRAVDRLKAGDGSLDLPAEAGEAQRAT